VEASVTERSDNGHEETMAPAPAIYVAPIGSIAPVVGTRDAPSRVAAFRSMYEAQLDFVWRNLRRLGVSEAEVDDKAQEVFVIAHRRFGEFEERGHGPRAWLFQIAIRVASDARRHSRRHPIDPDGGVAQDRESIGPTQADALDARRQLDQLDRALASIDVGRRAVLVLHEIEEMTAPEIARVPLNTVYSRLRVAREELEDAMARLRQEPGEIR
jgi:RNA polymerase sigma-70 factor (ECF subfamily)